MSQFVNDIRRAIQQGILPIRFRAADVRSACPGWAYNTYSVFLPKHRLGNPGGNVTYFRQQRNGSYRLLRGSGPGLRRKKRGHK